MIMLEVFDLYTKKTKLYYVLQTVSILTFAGLILAKLLNLQIPHNYSIGVITIVVIGLITIVLNLLLTATNIVKMYKKSGELRISERSISIHSTIIPFEDIQKIVIDVSDYRGARASDGSGNKIKIITAYYVFKSRFVIGSKLQNESLKQLLSRLKENGIKIE